MKSGNQIRNRYVLILDLFLIIVSVLGGYALRLELGAAFYFYLPSAFWMAGAALIVKPVIYYMFGLYRRLWIYASTQELKLIIVAVSTASMLVSLIMISLFSFGAFTGFPRSVLIIDWLLSVFLVGGVRFAVRLLSENRIAASVTGRFNKKRTLIIGAGDAGALVVRELQKNPQLEQVPVGFLDDNPAKLNQQIYGVPIIGGISDLSRVLENQHVDEVLIAIPSAPGKVVRKVTDVCRLKNVSFRTMPGIYELIGGKVNVNRLREVEITDLLRREPTHILEDRIKKNIGGKVVLVTGGGGSIGSELCRQIARWEPAELIMLGHGENSIFEAVLNLQKSFPELKISPVIADIRDYQRICKIFCSHKPQILFHAAAHKHVPLMEMNVQEAVTNNVGGTRNVVNAAVECGIEQLVMISTDKAIRPANIMGATKRMAEMIVLDAARRTGKDYSVVRFGNVLGSRGSVVPIFKYQISVGGPVTVTHPDMKRFFMTIPEAVHLVLQAASMSDSYGTYVLNMGEQVRILDLVEDLIKLSGLEPGRDIEIVFTGIRPGEKLSEDLWKEGHEFKPTSHPDIFLDEGKEVLEGEELQAAVEKLLEMTVSGTDEMITNYFSEIIPGAAFYPFNDDITSNIQ